MWELGEPEHEYSPHSRKLPEVPNNVKYDLLFFKPESEKKIAIIGCLTSHGLCSF